MLSSSCRHSTRRHLPAARVGAAAPLAQAVSKETDARARARLAQAIAALVRRMDDTDADSITASVADALLDSLKRAIDLEVPFLSRPCGAVAEWMAPRDIADLLTKHKLPPACRRFETIDGAVRWFRDADPGPPKL